MSAGSRWSVVTSPPAPSHSACVRVRAVPAGPRSVSRTRPLMFCPRSKTCRPGPRVVTDTGRTSWTTRTGGAADGTEHRRRAVSVVDVELRQERRTLAELVEGPEHAHLAPEPAVGQHGSQGVRAGGVTTDVTSYTWTCVRLAYSVYPGVSSRSPTRCPLR